MGDRDPYQVLGVPVHADAAAIAAAYRALARRHHPDVSRHPDAERRMAAINAAWAILRDPETRAAHDRSRLKVPVAPARDPGPRPHAPADGTPGTPGTPAAGASGPARGPSAPHAAGRPGPAGPSAAPGVPQWRRGPDGEGAAGPPPGPRMGTVLPFGRHIGWSIGEVARVDPGYLQWLAARREGAPYREEIARILEPMLRRPDARRPGDAAASSPGHRRRRLPFR